MIFFIRPFLYFGCVAYSDDVAAAKNIEWELRGTREVAQPWNPAAFLEMEASSNTRNQSTKKVRRHRSGHDTAAIAKYRKDNKWYDEFIKKQKQRSPCKKLFISLEASTGGFMDHAESIIFQQFQSRVEKGDNLLVLPEPVKLWGPWEGKCDKGFDNPEKNPFALSFQLAVLKSYHEIMASAEYKESAGLVLQRSAYTQYKVYTENSMVVSKLIDLDEFDLYIFYYEMMEKVVQLQPDIIIYVTAKNHTTTAARRKEKEGDFNEEFHKRLHARNELVYNNDETSKKADTSDGPWVTRILKDKDGQPGTTPIYVLDGDLDEKQVSEQVEKLLDKIYNEHPLKPCGDDDHSPS